MRLIDAEAEIKKIEEEIERSYKAIGRWRSRRKAGINLYEIEGKIRQIKNNIVDCKREICMLKSYTTAYDVDKVVEQLEEEREDSNADFEQYAESHGLDGENDFYFEGLKRAISIVKGGEING